MCVIYKQVSYNWFQLNLIFSNTTYQSVIQNILFAWKIINQIKNTIEISLGLNTDTFRNSFSSMHIKFHSWLSPLNCPHLWCCILQSSTCICMKTSEWLIMPQVNNFTKIFKKQTNAATYCSQLFLVSCYLKFLKWQILRSYNYVNCSTFLFKSLLNLHGWKLGCNSKFKSYNSLVFE